MAGKQWSSRADQKQFNCRMSFLFTFWRQNLRKLDLTLCFLSASRFCQRHNLPGENDWNPQWEKKKIEKEWVHYMGMYLKLVIEGYLDFGKGGWKAGSLSDSCVFFTRIWFREEMWPLQTTINCASISFKYINSKIKGKHLRVEKKCITCHRGLFPFHLEEVRHD